MKIYYQDADTSGDWNVLCDDYSVVETGETGEGRRVRADFKPRFKPTPQVDALAMSQAQFKAPRGNITCELALRFNVTYGAAATALRSISTFAALLDTKVNLKVEEGEEVQLYNNGVITSYDADFVNLSVDHSFVFLTDNVAREVEV